MIAKNQEIFPFFAIREKVASARGVRYHFHRQSPIDEAPPFVSGRRTAPFEDLFMPLFETHVTLECPRERVFDFLLRPANVVEISPPEMGLFFMNPPESIQVGSQLEFKVQGYGQVQTMVHEITELIVPERFCERQVRGLFKLWIHEHLFESLDAGRTKVTDRVEFQGPGGVLGLLVTEQKIYDRLEDAFDHRHLQLKKLLSANS